MVRRFKKMPDQDPAEASSAKALGEGLLASGPGGIFGGVAGGGGTCGGVMTVSQAAGLIKRVLVEGIPAAVKIVGQVSNFSDRTHWFFSLKDQGANLRCVCFASAARKMGFKLQDGMEVVASGRIDFFEGQGQVQLYVDRIDPVGEGALEIKFRQLCEELRRLGYFSEERKRALPVFPAAVAVVTSRTGAALQDVVNTARKRCPACRLMLYDVRVQGELAAGEIAAALDVLSAQGEELGIEVILLTRGGGSMEDLWAFNERVVADAVYRCRLPVVAAIGHETDTTIAELVADLRCATPTQAAMRMIPDAAALGQQLTQVERRLRLLVERQIQSGRQRLEVFARQPFFRKPRQLVDPLRQRLGEIQRKLAGLVRTRQETAEHKLDYLARHLEAIGPMNVLRRGYSYTLDADGKLLRSAQCAKEGDGLTTVLADGKVASRVVNAEGGDAERRKQVKPAPRKTVKRREADSGLFEGLDE
ncbi:MAG: exodeoxyribonuclease VII large subunit [Phycisphaeraceae bacterium]|nr:exodeoxyribonuclease VII large subunit [Phycisphaeraceae bacterium]